MLYQKLIKLEDKDISDMDYGVIALDEFHHDTSKIWGSKVKILIGSHTDSIFLVQLQLLYALMALMHLMNCLRGIV